MVGSLVCCQYSYSSFLFDQITDNFCLEAFSYLQEWIARLHFECHLYVLWGNFPEVLYYLFQLSHNQHLTINLKKIWKISMKPLNLGIIANLQWDAFNCQLSQIQSFQSCHKRLNELCCKLNYIKIFKNQHINHWQTSFGLKQTFLQH